MACTIIYSRGNKPAMFIKHSRSRGARRRKCVGCGQCSPSIRALDRHFCPNCAELVVEGACLAGGIPIASVPCRGVLVEEDGLCVRHAVLFDEWMGHHGGEDVYRHPGLSRDEKRKRFQAWLVGLRTSDLNAILEKRHSVPGEFVEKERAGE